jgi:hypothetical protein
MPSRNRCHKMNNTKQMSVVGAVTDRVSDDGARGVIARVAEGVEGVELLVEVPRLHRRRLDETTCHNKKHNNHPLSLIR